MLRILLLFFSLFVFQASSAESNFNFDDFGKIAIQAEGRIKPLSTYSKYLLLGLSGKDHYESESSLEWLASLLFDPESSANKKVFLVNNPELIEALAMELSPNRRYSFKDLEAHIDLLFDLSTKASNIPIKNRSSVDKEFIHLFENLNTYIQVSNSFLYNFQHPDFTVSDSTKAKLGLTSNYNSLFDVIINAHQISEIFENKDFSNDTNKEVVRLAFLMYDWVEKYKNYKELYLTDSGFDVIPISAKFVSPWDQLLEPGIELSQEIYLLSKIQNSYLNKDYSSFEKLCHKYLELTYPKHGKSFNLELESLYIKVKPFFYSKLFYGLAFISILISLLFSLFKNISFVLTVIGFILHSFGLISRCLILERAPVSNLFETFIFVSWIIVLLGLLITFFDKKSSIGLLLASFAGLVLLLISGKFAMDGDTMKVLIAVLDSNFWLSTHVISVTIGYAGVFASGIVAHLFLINKILKRNFDQSKLMATSLGLLLFGLCFSFLGTLLGGIWADQSWGRFWGWDPKENGALLIVLWSTLVFHARMAGLVKETGTMLLTAFAAVVVITSWFGINLLGVGLHSYGFTSGIATGLYGYYLFELMFFAGFGLLLRKDNS